MRNKGGKEGEGKKEGSKKKRKKIEDSSVQTLKSD